MPKQTWTCSECDKTYSNQEQALECEKKHDEEAIRMTKIHEENSKMRFPKGIKITKSDFDTTGGNVDFDVPKDCDLIILMGNRGGGYVPYSSLLPHQVYMNDIRETFEEEDFEVIYIVPIKSKDVFPIAFKDKYSEDRWKK